MVAEAMTKVRAADGVAIAFDPPQQARDKLFAIFKARRVESYPDGRKLFVVSQQLYGERLSVDVISSSSDEKAAEKNLALFMLPIIMTAALKPDPGKGR
jgi:hypothetical protein